MGKGTGPSTQAHLYLLTPWSSCMWVVPGEWSGSAHGPGEHGRKHDDWRNIGPCDLAGPWYRDGWGGVESESWMALFRAGESSAPRFVGIAVSTNLFSDHEGELFHLNCTMRLSSTMTRLDLNRNARARRAETRLNRPLWAGKSSANASASARGQQGEPASVLFARFWAAQAASFFFVQDLFLSDFSQSCQPSQICFSSLRRRCPLTHRSALSMYRTSSGVMCVCGRSCGHKTLFCQGLIVLLLGNILHTAGCSMWLCP